MRSMEIKHDGRIFRWAGGSFIAVWTEHRSDEPVPDDLVEIDIKWNKSQLREPDIRQMCRAYSWRETLAKKIIDLYLIGGMAEIPSHVKDLTVDELQSFMEVFEACTATLKGLHAVRSMTPAATFSMIGTD